MSPQPPIPEPLRIVIPPEAQAALLATERLRDAFEIEPTHCGGCGAIRSRAGSGGQQLKLARAGEGRDGASPRWVHDVGRGGSRRRG